MVGDLVSWVKGQRSRTGTVWVIIDEVQLIREWERAVTSLHRRTGTSTTRLRFVMSWLATRVYVQVAYLLEAPETIAREVRPLLAVPDAYPRVIISLDQTQPGDLSGISHVYALDFLEGTRLV